MPIARAIAASVAVALLLLPPALYAQERRVLVRQAAQLTSDPKVRSFEEPYALVSSAYAIHERCAEKLGIAPEQTDFVKSRYAKLAQGYMDAFNQAYIARFRAPPPKELTEDFQRYIATVQKKAVTAILSNIDHRGCDTSHIGKILAYFTKLQQIEVRAEANQPPTPESPHAAE